MADYDISGAFKTIENELIDSMMRNFKRHRAEETKEGYNWTQWQAEQLKSLEEYKKRNAEKFKPQFAEINSKIDDMLRTAKADGNAEQEAKILNAIKNGFKAPKKPSEHSTGEFFKINERKLDALIKSTTDDLKRAETAVLRMSNDKYRKAIFNAQVAMNTGSVTYEQAVDMACKDMLDAGLNCVEYKNGARHTLSDYADMAIKTANKRAYLRGEGEERAKYGLSLVVVNSRQGGCPKCAEYIGKVFIDDVYSGGTQSDGKYPLLSNAIAGGLFHPRCKDSTSTYYEGITTLSPVTAEEMAEMDRREQLEAQQQYAQRQAQRFDRRAKYSLDNDNKRVAQARSNEWHDRADRLEEQNKNSVHKISDTQEQKFLTDTEIEKSDSSTENTNRSVENSENNDIIEFEKGVTQAVQENFTDEFEKMQDKFGKITTISRVGVLNSKTSSDYGAFYDNSGELLLRFANKKNALSKHAQKAQEMKKSGEWSSAHSLHTFRHEIGHAIQLEHRLNDPLWDDKLEQISKIMDGLNEPIDIDIKKYSVSRYSMTNIDDFISECIAESMTKKSRATAKEVVNIIIGVD
ncbi:MAG: hypothetical protein Q4A46_05980 [Clostridia bacterium]|nr:hypothetical protein [Clostridia bacterium]